ncbi:MAG: Type II secretion system protein E [Legionellaceae bacterium]
MPIFTDKFQNNELFGKNLNTEIPFINPDKEEQSIVEFVNKMTWDAIQKGASDIHIEPFENHYRIRYRQDGILYEIATLPKPWGERITARIKILSQLDIAERRLPQDGRFKNSVPNKEYINFRVSICPCIQGEKIVLRILNSEKLLLSINHLGLEPQQEKLVINSLQKSQGLILVTGPTGSGKTISLYSALNILNTSKVNITTIEDPIEIPLNGITQVNVNLKTGLTFPTALRAFLRQDPDIIMVGEMRDYETANIAIKAAQTGHLVLSTLHTNSAVETIIRLLNMGITVDSMTSSISLIIAQRLLRTLCLKCKINEYLSKETLLQQGFNEEQIPYLTLYKARHCAECREGYKGRIGIFEVLPMHEKIVKTILTRANSLDLTKTANELGMLNLRQAGLLKVKNGITSLAELNRVTQE